MSRRIDDDIAGVAQCISVATDGSVLILDQFGGVEQALENVQTWTEVTPAGWSSISLSVDLLCACQGKYGDVSLKSLAGTSSPWQPLPLAGSSIATVSFGVDNTGQEIVWAVDAERHVWTYVVASKQWAPQPGIFADMIAATSDGSVFRLDSGVLTSLDATAGWVTISTPAAPVSIAAATQGWLWLVGSSEIYQYDGVEGWVSIDPPVVDPAARLGCGNDTTTWLVAGGSLYSFDAKTLGWTALTGPGAGRPLIAVAVANSSTAAVIDDMGVIWRYTGQDQEFVPLPNVKLHQGSVLAAISRDQFYAVNNGLQGADSHVLAGTSTGGIKGPWTLTPLAQQPPQPLVWISATSQGDAWGVDAQGGAWELPAAGEAWQSRSQTPELTHVSVARPSVVAGIDTAGAAYRWEAEKAVWSPVSGQVDALVSIATTPHGALWAVDKSGVTYQWLGEWLATASQGLNAIAIGGAGSGDIWGIVSATGAPIQLGSQNDIAEAGFTQADVADSQPRLPTWETANPFDEAQSTHLWIVNRAAQLVVC